MTIEETIRREKIEGTVFLRSETVSTKGRWESFGWTVIEVHLY